MSKVLSRSSGKWGKPKKNGNGGGGEILMGYVSLMDDQRDKILEGKDSVDFSPPQLPESKGLDPYRHVDENAVATHGDLLHLTKCVDNLAESVLEQQNLLHEEMRDKSNLMCEEINSRLNMGLLQLVQSAKNLEKNLLQKVVNLQAESDRQRKTNQKMFIGILGCLFVIFCLIMAIVVEKL